MATWDDVRRLALALPATAERIGGHDGVPSWRVKDKLFVWERPLRKTDLAALGPAAPAGPILGAWLADLGDKEALLAEGLAEGRADGGPYFTTPHFDGHPMILVRLPEIDVGELEQLVTDAWLARAPAKLAEAFLDAEGPRST